MNNYSDKSISELKGWFAHFAENECKENANLYYNLCHKISEDDEIVKIASFAKTGQPMPLIFLSAVHFLLLKNSDEKIANFYPTISKNKQISEIPFDLFKIFCLKYETKIKEIIASKIVQTNVINRCSYLFPIIAHIVKNENSPTTIVDIGTSAGLTLNFADYEYWLNDQKVYGNSAVKIKSEIKEGFIHQIEPVLEKITKIGIDQNIIKPGDEEEKLWLKALIWADHFERFEAIDNALNSEKLNEINFMKGNTTEDFKGILFNIPTNQKLIIYATHTLYQFSTEEKLNFYNLLSELSKIRDFYFISAEGTKSQIEKYKTKNTVVELTTYKNQNMTQELIAETNRHGNWVSWKQIYHI